jgi:hypothetical protein
LSGSSKRFGVFAILLKIGRLSLLLALLGSLLPCYGLQFNTKLRPQTVVSFDAYARQVEQEQSQRCEGKKTFLRIEEDPETLRSVMNGQLFVERSTSSTPLDIPDGLIHDWYGAVFIPHSTLQRVLSVLQDFDHHAGIYPQVTRSKLIKRDGNDITGYWRLEQKKQGIQTVFDVTQHAHYEEISPSEWIVKSYAKDIDAVEGAGSAHERVRATGEGMGLLWRLYAYWNLKAVDGGVLAECRSVSLSRGLPGGIGWMIRPFLQSVPKDSMDSTLRSTRKAASE